MRQSIIPVRKTQTVQREDRPLDARDSKRDPKVRAEDLRRKEERRIKTGR